MVQVSVTVRGAAQAGRASSGRWNSLHRPPTLPHGGRSHNELQCSPWSCAYTQRARRRQAIRPSASVGPGPQGSFLGTANLSGSAGARGGFQGKWIRQSSESQGVVDYLVAHGLSEDQAKERANAKYEQEWIPTGVEEGEWRVKTDTYKGSRSIVYSLGEWEEPFEGGSDIFGEEPGVVYRNTSWEETPAMGFVHLTESATPLGWEATQRHVDQGSGRMVVRRIFTLRLEDGSAAEQLSCVEYFERATMWLPSA